MTANLVPTYPSDIRNCNRYPAPIPAGDSLDAGQTERLWATDRATIVRLNRCLDRADVWADGVSKIVGFQTGGRL